MGRSEEEEEEEEEKRGDKTAMMQEMIDALEQEADQAMAMMLHVVAALAVTSALRDHGLFDTHSVDVTSNDT